MINRPITLAILLFFPLAACADLDSPWTGTISDSAGVSIVSNPEIGIWASGEEWTFEEEIRIGVVEGAPEYQFGDINGITVDSKGRISVLDGQAKHVQVYSSEGVYEQTVGSPGEGPGEIQFGWGLFLGPGDTLMVADVGNMRVNRYAPDGTSAGSFRLVYEGRPLAFKATHTGLIAEHYRPSQAFGSEEAEAPKDVILLLGTDGVVRDTLFSFPPGEMLFDGGIRLYAPEPVWDLSEDSQLIFGVSDEYRIGFYSGGRLERVIAKPANRTPVGDREKEAVFSHLDRVWGELGSSPEQIRQMQNAWSFAGSFPAFHSVACGPMGSTWVRHIQPVSELSSEDLSTLGMPVNIGAPEWDVFDSEGRFLGIVTMPRRFTPMVFREENVYGVWRDENDVPFVVRLRIVGDLGFGWTGDIVARL